MRFRILPGLTALLVTCLCGFGNTSEQQEASNDSWDDRGNGYTDWSESGRFFCCPGSSAYVILEAEIPVVEKERFTTFLLLLAASICRVLPRFAE